MSLAQQAAAQIVAIHGNDALPIVLEMARLVAAELAARGVSAPAPVVALVPPPPPPPARTPETSRRIVRLTAAHFDMKERTLTGTSRKQRITWARSVAMYLIRHRLGRSLTDIGDEFGKDHTTVMHALARVASCGECTDVRELTAELDSLKPQCVARET
jgi:hypothetical protein